MFDVARYCSMRILFPVLEKRVLAGLLSSALLGACSIASAGTFTLNADVAANNTNDGVTFVTDPHTATITDTGTASLASLVSIPGVTAFQNVTGTLIDNLNGSIQYNDGWNTNVQLGQVDMYAGLSTYNFTLTQNELLTMNWNSVVGGSGDGFGLYDLAATVDSTTFSSYVMNPPLYIPQPSGVWSINLGVGAHSIRFYDNGNIWGGLGVRNQQITDTLNFSMTPSSVPEPAALLSLSLGVVTLVRRVKRKN